MIFSLDNITFPKQPFICFEIMIFSFEKYERFKGSWLFASKIQFLFIQIYAKATHKWDELTFSECFWGKQFKK